MAPTLHPDLEKLTGSRPLFRHLNKSRWRPKTVSLHARTLRYANPGDHPKSLLLVPGTARLCTYSEQLEHKRPYMFRLKALPESAHHGDDRHVLLFSAPTSLIAAEWVRAANNAAFDAVLPQWTPLDPPLLSAWGHLPTVSAKNLPNILHRLNFKLPIPVFAATYMELHAHPLGKELSIRQFIDVILYRANLGPVLSAMLQHSENDQLSPIQLSQATGWTLDEATTRLQQQNVQNCSSRLLIQFLFDQSNSLIDEHQAQLSHDMTRPLNEYIISSSHNTYLTGDQLKSDSSAEMYRIVLEKNCRCVEIDMWDGEDGQPVVRHGHTITSSESLKNVIVAIAEHAFSHGNEYPVILSLENHLTLPQQVIAGNMIKDILGPLLYTPQTAPTEEECLPSPEQLKNKLLLKAKTGRPVLKSSGTLSGDLVTDAADYEDDDSDKEEREKLNEEERHSIIHCAKPKHKPPPEKEAPKSQVADEIAELVFLAGGNRKSLMELWKKGASGKAEYVAASCVSLSEKKIAEVVQGNLLEQIREYNSHSLTRVYPKGTRVDSSNYVPTLAHHLGCQIVALNWQGEDTGLAVNEARFLSNRGCGYVLSKTVSEPEQPGTLQFEVLSAFLLPSSDHNKKTAIGKKDIIDSYCSLSLYDMTFAEEEDFCSFKFQTQVARSNGFAPVWREKVDIPVKNRALSVLVLKVYDHDRTSEDDFVGYCPIPVALLRQGARCCPLKSGEGEPYLIPGTSLRPSILCKTQWL